MCGDGGSKRATASVEVKPESANRPLFSITQKPKNKLYNMIQYFTDLMLDARRFACI